MSVFRREQNRVHSMQGNHIAGVATPTSGARQVEMWRGRMDANSATPPLYDFIGRRFFVSAQVQF